MMEAERKILATKKMSQKELEEAIQKEMASGARNRVSAVNKLYRKVSVEEVGEEDVHAYFLQDYERKRGGLSVYLQTKRRETVRVTVMPETPPPEKMLNIGQAIVITNCLKKRNIFTGLEWMETTANSRVKPSKLDLPFFKSVGGQLPTEGGIAFVKGKVIGVWEVSKFDEEGRRGESMPILAKGGVVNLRLTLEPEDIPDGKRMSVKLVDEKRLKMLVGDDIEWLAEDGAVMELSDMLKNTSVLVFGSVRDTIGRGRAEQEKVNPYWDLRNFGWVVPSPEEDVGDAPIGGDEEVQGDGKPGWGASDGPLMDEADVQSEDGEEGDEEDADDEDVFVGEKDAESK